MLRSGKGVLRSPHGTDANAVSIAPLKERVSACIYIYLCIYREGECLHIHIPMHIPLKERVSASIRLDST